MHVFARTGARSAVRQTMFAVLVAGGATSVGIAYAASLNATTDYLGTGRSAVPLCNMAGVQSTEVTGANTITGVTVTRLDAVCQGDTLRVTVNVGGGVTSSASGVVPAGGGTLTLVLGAPVAFADNANIDLVVSGP